MSFGVHIGPYLRVPFVAAEDVRTLYSCSVSCGGVKDSRTAVKFCSQCGAAVLPVETRTPVMRAPAPWDVKGEQFDDLMWRPESDHSAAMTAGHAVWLPNRRGYGLSFSRETPHGEVTLNDDVAREHLVAFKEAFGEFIHAIEQQLGVTPVVRFGVVSYHH